MKLVAPLLCTLALAAALASPAAASGLTDALMRSGLGPDALAAAGVTSGEVGGIVSDVEDHLDANPDALTSADSDYVAAKQEVDRLRRRVRSGLATEQDVTDLATEKTDLATAEADRASAVDAIFDAGTADLSADEKTALSNLRANRRWGAPIEFKVVNRTDPEWLDLCEALADEEAADELGVAQDPDCEQLLLDEGSDSDVSAAKTAFDTNVDSVRSAWETAVSGG